MAVYVLHSLVELGTSLGESPCSVDFRLYSAPANQRAARRRAGWLAG